MPSQRTRTLAEIPWLSLLPPEQRARLETPYEDPSADRWDGLVAADRSVEADPARPSNMLRIVKPLVAAGVLAVMLLADDAPRDAEQHVARGGSSATASGSITASATAAPRTLPEENRVALTSRSTVEVTGTEVSGRKDGKSRGGGSGAPASPSTPTPPAAGEPETPRLASATLPVVGDVEVPAPNVELPQLPHLPPLQQQLPGRGRRRSGRPPPVGRVGGRHDRPGSRLTERLRPSLLGVILFQRKPRAQETCAPS